VSPFERVLGHKYVKSTIFEPLY